MNLRQKAKELFGTDQPFAITMWEFSWIERRWPGAGYEDWDNALDELTDRGYNAVRIDAFPHLVSKDINREWMLEPVWNLQSWGAPAVTRICLKDDFREFLKACRRHRVRVGLSTWFRQDVEHTEMEIHSPEDHAKIWVDTLDRIREWGELDNILYVDMCNEFPLSCWAPFLCQEIDLYSQQSVEWMKGAVAKFKKHYPDMPVTFSFTGDYKNCMGMDVSYLDFLEPHIWMPSTTDFYDRVGYRWGKDRSRPQSHYTNKAGRAGIFCLFCLSGHRAAARFRLHWAAQPQQFPPPGLLSVIGQIGN